MSTLYLASDPRCLADRLADELDHQSRAGDLFTPALIVIPNRYLKKWLRLTLARRLDVAINLHFLTLEEAFKDLLAESTSDEGSSFEPIDEKLHRLLVLAVLLEEREPSLAPLRRYVRLQGDALSRLSCRRAWYLADRLSACLRAYETHRQDALIQPWLDQRLGISGPGEFQRMMERAQRAVYLHIARGRLPLLNRAGAALYQTLPQFALERMQAPISAVPSRIVHFFGFTHLADLEVRVLDWLGGRHDVRLYCPNVLADRCTENLAASAQEWLRESGDDELLRRWGRAGAESLGLLARLQPTYPLEKLSSPRRAGTTTVLTRVQDQLLGLASARSRLDQDTSLQIVGCAGVAREVDALYNSILHNLHVDPTLRQSDIAILVTDMARYRAPLQAVFERPPLRVQLNMVDFSAAGISMFGQALLAMLDLALDSFARARVFEVILNPCFLARLGIDRAQAMTWLTWAESLGIYQGWDADEKEQQGYPRSPFYAWRLGLQRLRLGRVMDAQSEDVTAPATRFAHIVPFADIDSTDREQLDAFSRAVEGLLPTLARLRSVHWTGERWARALERLVMDFLDVPDNRPEEAQVRGELLAGLAKLAGWDACHEVPTRATLPLALVREYVQSLLEALQGNQGEYLVGGVTIAELQPMRPIPFPVVYVLGLGEDLFPGSNALSSFDLRGGQHLPGDIRPAEAKLYDFLSAVMSAQRKLYLFFNNHDLQKDQPLLPAVPLQQLQRHLDQQVLKGECARIAMPLHADDPRYLDAAQQPAYQDVLAQQRDAERFQAVLAARTAGRLVLKPAQEAEWASRWREMQRDFTIAPAPAEAPPASVNVSTRELRRFLELPAHEALRRHLRVEEDDDEPARDGAEPLVTSRQAAGTLVRQTIQQIIVTAGQTGVQAALAGWQDRLASSYADARLRSQVPEDAFGEIDQAALLRDLQERIHGQGQIEAFLRSHADHKFCGPLLLGESATPIGARLHFPALRLRPGHELAVDAPSEIRIVGSTPFAWHSAGRFEMLIVTNGREFDGRELVPALLEPMLLYLALLANPERNAQGIPAEKWLAGREFLLHIAHRAGLQTWRYAPGEITSAEACHYLRELARDFLDPTQFDLLPLEVLCDKIELRQAFHETGPQLSAAAYRTLLEETLEEVRENSFGGFQLPLLVEMMHAQVPADALAKIQRRFRLLDRGPAKVRQPGL